MGFFCLYGLNTNYVKSTIDKSTHVWRGGWGNGVRIGVPYVDVLLCRCYTAEGTATPVEDVVLVEKMDSLHIMTVGINR